MNTTEKRDFDQAALTWDSSPTRMQLASDVSATMLTCFTPHAGLRVLDFGCGTGLISLPWAAQINHLTGADSAQGMLDVFAGKAAQHGLPNVSTQHLDLENGGQLGGPFDLIVSSMTLHHIHDTAALLAHLFKALAPAGQVCLADLDPDGGLFHSDNTGVLHFGFEREALRQLLANAGFVDIEASTAAEVRKSNAEGERCFSIFLLSARKPAA